MTRRNHFALGCILLACVVACSDQKDESSKHDEPATEAVKAQTPVQATPGKAPAEAVLDKSTCPAGCTKSSTTQPAPGCCTCAGREGLWKKSTFSSTTWLCER